MLLRLLLAALCCALLLDSAEARVRHGHPHVRAVVPDPGCNIIFPCEGVVTSPRGERVVKAMGGFGTARKIDRPGAARPSPRAAAPALQREATIVSHPVGCPSRAFCGCGAAVRVFGSPVRSLWLAANWFKFPRAMPGAGMVAVRRHHVFVLEAHLEGGTWLAYDANSGGHATRIHARSIRGYTIVNPHAAIALAWRA
ncbi:hypothetical protein ABH973_006684 [Bradyrhizobium ottawaense]|uniref:hypothetical protein n=1 Tax=Bradyrhizobium ottawaense TaxID=931866 RepID=UPI003511D002